MKPKGLGKGLSAIFETETHNSQTAAITSSMEIALSLIKANESQPRTKFDADALDDLASSIGRLGLIQPIAVRQIEGGRYEIISGERRYRAAKMAGLESVPAYVRTVGDAELLEMALVENVQREELGAMEIALTLQRLTQELGLTQEELSRSVGCRRSSVANYLRLLSLPPLVQQALQNEAITMGHAKIIAGCGNEAAQELLLDKIVKKALSVRATEEELAKSQKPKTEKTAKKVDYSPFNATLEQVFGKRNVSIESRAKGGRVSIAFTSTDDLQRIVDMIAKK